MLKNILSRLLFPFAYGVRTIASKAIALWSFARLRESIRYPLHTSNVVLGSVTVDGTGNIRIGHNTRIYPGVVLETQGKGCIVIGDHVVLSRGVHIVAFDSVHIDDHCMVGEYSSLRDADHKKSQTSMRLSGHESAPIHLAINVWVGRGVSILKGVQVGANSIVGANAVVTRNIPANSCAVGVPARIRALHYSA